jgi:hypothetical protein
MTSLNPPTITAQHLQQAFTAMCWAGWTFEQAMANDMRRRLVNCRAHQIATRELSATLQPTRQHVHRVRLDAHGNPVAWCTQIVMGPKVPSDQPELYPANQPENTHQ